MSARLRAAREGAGLTQQQIADATGASLKTVNNYENPKYLGAKKLYILRDWAELCGRNIEEITGPARRPLARSGCTSQTPAYALAS